MQTTSFQHYKIWIIFNIFYTIYICYTNTQIIVLKTPDMSYHGNSYRKGLKSFYLMAKKYDKYWDLPEEKCEIETF